jgi:hypothetical protein
LIKQTQQQILHQQLLLPPTHFPLQLPQHTINLILQYRSQLQHSHRQMRHSIMQSLWQ